MRGLEPIGFVLVVLVCGSFPHPRPAVSVLSFDGALSLTGVCDGVDGGWGLVDTEEFVPIF